MPYEEIRKIFYSESNIIFIDHQGFWLYSKKESKRILLPNINDDTFSECFDVQLAKKYLSWWMPLFTRWVPNAEKYDLIREELLVLIYRIFSKFKFYNINSIIFFTSVAHHVPGAIISIVAQLKKAKQIYLYFEIINGRLLPLEQMGAIDTRVPINYELNNVKCNKNLELFIQNKINNKEPVHNLKEKAWKKSLIIAIAYLLKREISKIFIKLNFINTFKWSNSNIFFNLGYAPLLNCNGLFTTFCRESLGYSIYFSTYHYCKKYDIPTWISGGFAGVMNWSITYPIDVIKNRQLNYNCNIMDAYKIGNLYNGINFCLIRAMIVNSMIFTVYEKLNEVIN